MKFNLILIFCLLGSSPSVFAFEYKKSENGSKIFSSQWDSARKTGTITFEIESRFRESSALPGRYDLSTSKGNGVFQPSEACTVKFEGVIEYTADQTSASKNPIKLVFSGAGCQKFVENFPYKPSVMLPIWHISSSAGSDSNLSIRIGNTAMTECGDGNSLVEKVEDCLVKNKKLSKRIVRANVSTQWTLAAFNEKTTAVWRDDSTKVFWSGPPKIGKAANWAAASQTCQSDAYLKSLPKPVALEKATEHGLFLLYPLPGIYWTSEVEPISPEGQTLATTYQTGGGQTNDDIKFALIDRFDVKRSAYFHCVAQ